MSLFDYFQKETANHPLFPKVTEIELHFVKNWPLFSLQSLSMFINILQIVSMTMNSYYFSEYNENTLMDIGIFIEQAHNLSSLFFPSLFNAYLTRQNIENMCSILPHHTKHLEITINDLAQIKMILERCKNLSTINFTIKDRKFNRQIIKWFVDNTIDSTCNESCECITVWLGKKNI